MLKTSASGVLSRSSPCNVPQGYASVAELPAAWLDELFEHPVLSGQQSSVKRNFPHSSDFACTDQEAAQNVPITRPQASEHRNRTLGVR
jgi:hypothetical protein